MWLFTFTCFCILAYCVVYSRDVYNFCVPSVHRYLISVHRYLISASIFAKLQWASQAGVPVHLLILLFFIHGSLVQIDLGNGGKYMTKGVSHDWHFAQNQFPSHFPCPQLFISVLVHIKIGGKGEKERQDFTFASSSCCWLGVTLGSPDVWLRVCACDKGPFLRIGTCAKNDFSWKQYSYLLRVSFVRLGSGFRPEIAYLACIYVSPFSAAFFSPKTW